MIEPEDIAIIKRGQQYAEAMSLRNAFADAADDVEEMWRKGVPDTVVDRHLHAWIEEEGISARPFLDDERSLDHLTSEQKDMLAQALRFDEWIRECVKAIARTGKPLPFFYAIGDVFVDTDTLKEEGDSIVWAVGTRATNPEVIAKKFVKTCKQVFGDQVTKDQRPKQRHAGQLTPTEALGRFKEGMSYREIAIQNLRYDFPDVIEHPHRYRAEIKKERHAVIEEIRTAQKLWGERMPELPTD